MNTTEQEQFFKRLEQRIYAHRTPVVHPLQSCGIFLVLVVIAHIVLYILVKLMS